MPSEASDAINSIVEYVGLGFIGICVAYAMFNIGLACSYMFSERIKSQEELDRVVEEEALKLGLDPSEILAIYNYLTTASGQQEGTGKYFLTLTIPSSLRSAVRHELWHIARGDIDYTIENTGFKFELRKRFIIEPRAHLYALFGIRL